MRLQYSRELETEDMGGSFEVERTVPIVEEPSPISLPLHLILVDAKGVGESWSEDDPTIAGRDTLGSADANVS